MQTISFTVPQHAPSLRPGLKVCFVEFSFGDSQLPDSPVLGNYFRRTDIVRTSWMIEGRGLAQPIGSDWAKSALAGHG